jgi:hypothetical protein
MNQSVTLEQIKKLQDQIGNTIEEIEKSEHPSFFKTMLKQQAISMFELAEKLDFKQTTQSIPEETPIVNTSSLNSVIKKEEVQEIFVPEETPIVELKTEKKPQAIRTMQLHEEAEAEETDISINEKISKNKAPVINYADKSKEIPIKDLSKAISIGKKFEFINGLFDGNSDVYKTQINLLQNCNSYEEAISLLENEVVEKYEWEHNEKLAAEFFSLIRRRFNM